jgi:hypothetical protein
MDKGEKRRVDEHVAEMVDRYLDDSDPEAWMFLIELGHRDPLKRFKSVMAADRGVALGLLEAADLVIRHHQPDGSGLEWPQLDHPAVAAFLEGVGSDDCIICGPGIACRHQ